MSSAPKPISSTTQEFLDIHDITNNIVILKDASASMILRVSAMNFGLLAEEEQDAVIYTYAALLNSLNYSVQIIIQSQTKDASSYLKLLEQQEGKTNSPDKKSMIVRYRKFVSELIKEHNVLDKKFYVVIPATSLEMGFISPQSVMPGSKGFDINSVEKTTIIEKALSILEPRRDHLLGQFNRIGLFAYQLETQDIIRVFYNNYNPGSVEGQQLTDTSNYTTAMVRASMSGNSASYQAPQVVQSQPAVETQAEILQTPTQPPFQPENSNTQAQQPAAYFQQPDVYQPTPEPAAQPAPQPPNVNAGQQAEASPVAANILENPTESQQPYQQQVEQSPAVLPAAMPTTTPTAPAAIASNTPQTTEPAVLSATPPMENQVQPAQNQEQGEQNQEQTVFNSNSLPPLPEIQ